jgi:hypothetical protein
LKYFKVIIFLIVILIAILGAFAWLHSLPPWSLHNWEGPSEITKVEFISNNTAIVTIQNSGRVNITSIFSATVNEEASIFGPNEKPGNAIPAGSSTNFTVILKDGKQFNIGEEYIFKLYSHYGYHIECSATYNPTT